MLAPNNLEQSIKHLPSKKQTRPQNFLARSSPTKIKQQQQSTPASGASERKPSKDFDSLDLLRTVPDDQGFDFCIEAGQPTGITAVSMVDFAQKLKTVPIQSVTYHYQNKDFQKWFSEIIGDDKLSQRLNNISKGLADEGLRKGLLKVVFARIAELQMSPEDIRVAQYMGIYTSVILAITTYFFIAVWPSTPSDVPLNSTTTRIITLYGTGVQFPIGAETSLIFIMMFSGIIGACVFSLFAISHHVGADKDFSRLWRAWYLLRPLVGAGLALIFYLVLRGGVLNLGANLSSLNIVSLTAVTGLVGMFAEQAMHKLQDVADSLFGQAPDTAKASAGTQSGTGAQQGRA